MNSLSGLDIRQLVSEHNKARLLDERDFEKNHIAFAECFAKGCSISFLLHVEANLKNHFHQIPTELQKNALSFSLDITDNVAMIGRFITKPCANLPPFNHWLEIFSKVYISSSKSYYKGMMVRVAEIAEKKLDEFLSEYMNHPKNNILKFKIILNKANPSLDISYWIEQEVKEQIYELKTPQPIKEITPNEITPKQKGVHISSLAAKKSLTQASLENAFDDFKDF